MRNAERERDAERSHRRKLESGSMQRRSACPGRRTAWQRQSALEWPRRKAELLSTEHEQLMHASVTDGRSNSSSPSWQTLVGS